MATPKDANYIQTNVVRVDGKREVYIPVFRQLGASTLRVVNNLRDSLKEMEGKLTRSGINLKLVLDQSVYVQKSIEALVQEGLLGAVLCSLVILMFLGEWRMTGIAIMTLPISCLACCAALYFTGQTINTMTLAGMTLAIGPMIDSAIICLENTHRHLGMGVTPREAAFLGASEVAMPELVSTLCTFLVLSPLVLTPGLGQFLFKPMAMAVAFSMIAAYFLSRTLVPACSAFWLKPHASHVSRAGDHAHGPGEEDAKSPAEAETFQINGNGHKPRGNIIARAFHRWERMIDTGIEYYVKGLDFVLRHRIATVVVAYSLLALTIAFLWPILRKEFFPEVDAGSFEMYVRAPSGLRIEETEKANREGGRLRPRRSSTRKTCNWCSRNWASRPTGRRPTHPTPARWMPSSRFSSRPSGRNRPRNTWPSCARVSPASPSSATWNLPSTPAAWSARR